MLSDHFLASIEVSSKEPPASTKSVPYHKYKSINKTSFLLILRPLILYWIHRKILIRWRISKIIHLWIALKNMHLLVQSICHRELCSFGTSAIYKLQKDLEDIVNACGLELPCLFSMKYLRWLDCMLHTSLPLPILSTIKIRSRRYILTRKLVLAC